MVNDGSKDQTTEVRLSLARQESVARGKNLSLLLQVALRYTREYGPDKVRVMTLVKNRGKGGAVRMVSPAQC